MSLSWGTIRLALFGISPDEASFSRRGFPGQAAGPGRAHLERAAATFIQGYRTGLQTATTDDLAARLEMVERPLQGFAYEGASMALALLDVLTPWNRRRIRDFLAGPGDSHVYMAHVGVGWAIARLGRSLDDWLPRFDPLLRWLAADGYGFHEGFFRWRRCFQLQRVPAGVRGYSRRMFDAGLGRCAWFVFAADVRRIRDAFAAFPPQRRADLWSGLGLACAYAGGADRDSIEMLRDFAGDYLAMMAQGTAFAAKARLRAGNLTPDTEAACEIICGLSAEPAARLTDAALEGLPEDGGDRTPLNGQSGEDDGSRTAEVERPPAFEVWRQRVRAGCAAASGVEAR